MLRHEFFVNPDRFPVPVKDGVVTLAAKPETEEVGRKIVRMVRHVQGVVAVRDRLSYPSLPTSVDVLAEFPID